MPVKVYWAPFTVRKKSKAGESNIDHGLQIVYLEPEPLYKYILSRREKSLYLKCYALIDSLKNAYIIKAPFDMSFKFDRANAWLSVDGMSQETYDNHIINRDTDYGENDPVLITSLPTYIFYSDDSVQMTVWPTPIIGEPENSRVIVGSFDISKWVRPIDWTFEFVDHTKPVTVKQGDPLFTVIFHTKKNEKVVLQRVLFTQKLFQITAACTQLKRYIKFVPLHKCYEMASGLLSAWRKDR